MSDEIENGDETGRDDRELAEHLDDWCFCLRGILRVVERLGRGTPPLGADQAAELAQLIALTDGEFARIADDWSTVVRPELTRHEDHPPPWMVEVNGESRYVPLPAKHFDSGDLIPGVLVSEWTDGAGTLLTAAEKLADCIPPADAGVAYSVSAYHLPRVDDLFDRAVTFWQVAVRPALKRFERRPRR